MIGWYHSGPKLRPSDLQINELFRNFTPNPVLVVVDVKPNDVGIPTDAYFAVDEIQKDGKSASKTFMHLYSEIGAEEAEEICVEHLLRDIKDNAIGTLSTRIGNQVDSLKGLEKRILEMHNYVSSVVNQDLPVNHEIIYNLQDMFSLLPNLDVLETAKAFSLKANDQYMIIYLSSLIRSVIALHNLINNKITNRDAENLEINEAQAALSKLQEISVEDKNSTEMEE
jgi:26S proteasome regulatory subunit N8